jgi:hypothetical protein
MLDKSKKTSEFILYPASRINYLQEALHVRL